MKDASPWLSKGLAVMTDEELEEQLQNRRAVVVHFSHHANMNQNHPVFPGDLLNAIEHRSNFPLSCSVVWPSHTMDLVGSVGLLFKLKSANVISVCNTDAGANVLPDGTDGSMGVPLTIHSFASTFQPVGPYNEWRVQGAEVMGIFVVDVNCIYTKRQVEFDVAGVIETTISAEETTLGEIFQAFPSQRIFTMSLNGLKEIRHHP